MARTKRELVGEDGSSRGFYSEDNRVNDLTGREWVFWTRSVITKPYPPNLQHALRNRHGGQKPPDLCADLRRAGFDRVRAHPLTGGMVTLFSGRRSGGDEPAAPQPSEGASDQRG